MPAASASPAVMSFYVVPLALALYLLPLALVLVVRSSRGRPAWEIALDIPSVVGIDILFVETLGRVFLLETAILVSRALWAIAAGAWWWSRIRRQNRPAWPSAIGPRQLAALFVVVGVGVLLSVQLSQTRMIWDREWHMSLSTAIRGQTLPFHSVFEPQRVLRYHITGDVLGTEIQVLSGEVMNAALALSLAHDVLFALIALAIGLAFIHFGNGRFGAVLLAPLFLLVGPFVVRGPVGAQDKGYSFHDLLSLSFRPGIVVGELFIVGFTIAVAARLRGSESPLRKTLIPLLACTAALGLSDESSLGTLGLALGVTWLFFPSVVAATRRAGVAVFAALAGAVVIPNVLFSSALAPGGPLQKITHVAWRNPGFHNAPLPLSAPQGWNVLICDTLPFALALVAVLLAAIQTRSRDAGAVAVFATVVCAISTFALTSLKINQDDDNVQRFMVAPLLVVPLVGLLAHDRWWSGTIARSLLVGGVAAGVFSTILWLRNEGFSTTAPPSMYNPPGYDLYAMDCRQVAGSHFGERPVPAYVDATFYYGYVGCRPVYVPGNDRAREMWDMKVFPDATATGFALFDTMVGTDDLRVVCPTASPGDAICARITDRSSCTREGNAYLSCAVSPHERQRILAGR